MNNIYTFLLYFAIGSGLLNIHCFKLDIGQTVNYVGTEGMINVWKSQNFKNLYTHELDYPEFLEEIYNKDKKLYLNPLLTDNQVILSASVLWVKENPLVVQLNLENSSLVLLNDGNSALMIQAIFSERTNTNLNVLRHLESEQQVDVDLLKDQDYESNSVTVNVSKLKLSNPRFKRYGLKYYNLDSKQLGKVIYNDKEIVTLSEPTETENLKENERGLKKETPLEIPSKNEVYGVYVYNYNNFPLVLEFLYTNNKRIFYAHTPKDKWHRIFFPSYNDPSYDDFLLNRLNYYSCVNGYKWTINIGIKTDTNNSHYELDNYCLGSDGVEESKIKLVLTFYTDHNYNSGKYRCFDHTPLDKTKFYVDYLTQNESIVQLQNTPDVIDFVRVYHHLDLKPYLLVFVTPSKTMHYYVYEDKAWSEYEYELIENLDDKFSEKIRKLLDELVIDDRGEKKVPKMKLSPEALNLLPESTRILAMDTFEYRVNTIVKDKKRNKSYNDKVFDLWWYNSVSYNSYALFQGNLNGVLKIETREGWGLASIKYYSYTICNFEDDITIHRIDYSYDPNTYNMTVHMYSNILYVYTFRKNYYESSYLPWKFIGVKPMKVLEKFTTFKKYFELVNKLNELKVKDDDYVENPLDLLESIQKVDVLDGIKPTINTICYDNLHKQEIKAIEFEIMKFKEYGEYLEVEGDLESMIRIKTKPNVGINHIKYKEHTVRHFKDGKTFVHFIEYYYITIPYSITAVLYTNTLFVYTYRKNRIDSYDFSWPLLYKNPARFVKTKKQEKYLNIMRNIENFDFGE